MSRTRSSLLTTALAVLFAFAALGLIVAGVASIYGQRAVADVTAAVRTRSIQQTRSNLRLLESELQTYRLLPLMLGEYPDVRAALASGSVDPALNEKLAMLARRTGAPVIYALDTQGMTIAASNAGQPDSFLGHDYRYREYFTKAMASGATEFFALGSVSGRPGLYLSRRIERAGRPLGVVVVKVEFAKIARAWIQDRMATFVTDPDGIILISSDPRLQFKTTRPLTAARRAMLAQTRQFGGSPLVPAPLTMIEGGSRLPDGTPAVAVSLPVPIAGWRLVHMEPLDAALRTAAARTRWATTLAALLTIGAMLGTWWVHERRKRNAGARAELEAEVARRTAELRATADRLQIEVEQREASDQRFRQAREELAHANRVGSIGTITASVAHEINQPVAAIRTFADNAAAFLDRGEPARAATNLQSIVDLTSRIGTITAGLRRYARRGAGSIGPVALDEAIDGVRLLIGDRFRAKGVTLDLPNGPEARLTVIAGRVRLEQVLVNLLQNALDAVADRRDARVSVTVGRKGRDVVLTVADNGPGIEPDIADHLFTPFATSKKDGLGLGLGIARDIMTEFGGTLDLVPAPEGAIFRMILVKA
ncbi:two-component system C4-dicarboxylate transport sensor histidine kinase DctB [Sphingomonas sp. PP-CE-1A-559]|uniref:sensor histidine kinase n=1 Tax=Sphingomonas sp. PP-CE-1A-559 TaxID=2135657 RepID=UPI0010EBAB0C|nr:ATP-binding protein [Sphingomonas sp. PP-CE-1A-559]TCP90037.1 two-component system C4-dicarboxylate transport sensor histidine kinase DctB [Sphingomonas sp. PP-CE-1A-559]